MAARQFLDLLASVNTNESEGDTDDDEVAGQCERRLTCTQI